MIFEIGRGEPFGLEEGFFDAWRDRPVPWGFGALSWATYKRTYSRDGESWWQTCRRVVEGAFEIQRLHCLAHGLPWDPAAARAQAREAYARMWRFQWLPPGRGLWIMGTPFVRERGGAALNNCGFVSTRDLAADYAAPFQWMMQMSMVGVGVGYDTRGAGAVEIRPPVSGDDVHVIGDSREGWSDALGRLLGAFTGRGTLPARWDFSRIRPRGTPLTGFGGTASGPEPLQRLLEQTAARYREHAGRRVDSTLIVDTMNLIGCCVIAGGSRRSAQIAFGRHDDAAFLDLKQDREKLEAWRWASNNSVFAEIGMDYGEVARRTAVNGEPGYLWLDNARRRGRLEDPADGRDEGAMGSNPCAEQTLWDRELCCLVETYPAHHDTLDDFLRTVRAAFLYAKTVTLVPTHDAATNAVMLRNRRIGCSMTGVVQAINKLGYRTFLRWCDTAYREVQRLDVELSARFAVPRSIKTTSVKPSGTVSLLAGATPGVHWDHAPFYLRRVRVAHDHPLVEMCRAAGYPVEPDRYATDTEVITFPIRVPALGRAKSDVPLREKLDLAAQMQRWWSDNQVSCTAEFDPETEAAEIPRLLEAFEDRLKSISFLPASRHGYHQAPYERIDEDRYRELARGLRSLHGTLAHEHELESRYCEGEVCEL